MFYEEYPTGVYQSTNKASGKSYKVEIRYGQGWNFKWVHNVGSFAIAPLDKWLRKCDLMYLGPLEK
jgi:hypothetical protein